jgi:putative peptide zinc metalloprotease protein
MRSKRTTGIPLEGSLLSGPADRSEDVDRMLERALQRDPPARIDLWEDLGRRLDPAEFRPKLSDDVEVKSFRLRWGNDYAMIANPRDLIHFELTPSEALLIPMMDGTRTVGEIVVEHLRGSGDLEIAQVVELVRALHAGRFFDERPADVDTSLETALGPRTAAGRKAREFATTLMLPWTAADRFVQRVYPFLRWAFTPAAGAVFAVIAVGGLAAFVGVYRSGRYSFSPTQAPLESLTLLGLGLVLTFIHELGHSLVVVHGGRRIKSAGFMLYFGSPAFFVDVSDGQMMDRRQRILESAAGPASELVVAGVATMALWAFPGVIGAALLYRFIVINYLVIFENLVPLLELDGYFILADAIEVPDLRARSLQYVQHDLWHQLRSRLRPNKQEVGLLLYGVIGVAFTIFSVWTAVFFWREIFGGLVTGLWRGGVGGRFLLLLLGLFFGGPAIRGAARLVRAIVRRLESAWQQVRFRIESGWRVEAAEMIDALPLFEDLPAETLSDIAGRVRLRTVQRGQALFRQGDRADAFYIVRRGTIRIEEEDHDAGSVRTLRGLQRGEAFGELGLLEAAPRAATARGEGRAEVFLIDKGTFDRLLSDVATAPELGPTLQSMSELRALPAFAHLGSRDIGELIRHGGWIKAAPSEELVRQGEVGDAFYAIRSGQVDVIEDGRLVRTLGPGSYFGEIALLQDVPRTATVVARTPVRAYRLTREGFERLISGAFSRGMLRSVADQTWEH